MKVFTLEEFEKYYQIKEKQIKFLNSVQCTNKKLKEVVELHIDNIERNINKKDRLLYILRKYSSNDTNTDITYIPIIHDYVIIGNVDDVIFRVK